MNYNFNNVFRNNPFGSKDNEKKYQMVYSLLNIWEVENDQSFIYDELVELLSNIINNKTCCLDVPYSFDKLYSIHNTYLDSKNIELWYLTEYGICFDNQDKKILYTGLFFMDFNISRRPDNILEYSIEKTELGSVYYDNTFIINEITYFFYLLKKYYLLNNKDTDIIDIVKRSNIKVLHLFEGEQLKWSDMVDDWDILRTEAILRDLYSIYLKDYTLMNLFVFKGMFYNMYCRSINTKDYYKFLISYFTKMQYTKKVFYSEYFAETYKNETNEIMENIEIFLNNLKKEL